VSVEHFPDTIFGPLRTLIKLRLGAFSRLP
jgi:hypothetical protein